MFIRPVAWARVEVPTLTTILMYKQPLSCGSGPPGAASGHARSLAQGDGLFIGGDDRFYHRGAEAPVLQGAYALDGGSAGELTPSFSWPGGRFSSISCAVPSTILAA